MKEEIQRKAIAYIPVDLFHKVIEKGLVLPEGYEFERAVFESAHRNSIGIVIQSEHLPHTKPGHELPGLFVDDLGSHLVVRVWSD